MRKALKELLQATRKIQNAQIKQKTKSNIREVIYLTDKNYWKEEGMTDTGKYFIKSKLWAQLLF